MKILVIDFIATINYTILASEFQNNMNYMR